MRVTRISRQTLLVTETMLAAIGIQLKDRPRLQERTFGAAPDDWVSSTLLDEMYQAALHTTGRTELGLLMASSPAVARHGLFLMLVAHAPNLGQALGNLLTFSALSQETCELSVTDADDSRLAIRLMPNHVSPWGMVCRVDFLMRGLVQLIRLADYQWQGIAGIRLAFPPPPHAHLYPQYLGRIPQFDAPFNEIVLDRHVMAYPMPMADPVQYSEVLARAHVALAELRIRRGLIGQVETMLLQNLSQPPDSAKMAALLRMTDRTLRRQLAALGTSYLTVLAQCQKTKACTLLASGEHSVQQVAGAIGFASLPAFYRAFRRWTGQTPAAWIGNPRRGNTEGAD